MKNIKDIINHISNSLLKAESFQSKLSFEVLDWQGQSSFKIRHFLNNLMEMPNVNYLEIGILWGSTFMSSLYKNKLNSAYAIDIKFSDDFNDISQKLNLKFNKYECDCWKFDLNNIKHKINVFLYDGEHTYEEQYRALQYYYPILDDKFIFLVDDWTFINKNEGYYVEKGTRDSIRDLKLNTLYEKVKLSYGGDVGEWWNGFYIGYLQKQNI